MQERVGLIVRVFRAPASSRRGRGQGIDRYREPVHLSHQLRGRMCSAENKASLRFGSSFDGWYQNPWRISFPGPSWKEYGSRPYRLIPFGLWKLFQMLFCFLSAESMEGVFYPKEKWWWQALLPDPRDDGRQGIGSISQLEDHLWFQG